MTKDPIIRRIYCAAPLIRSQQQQQKKSYLQIHKSLLTWEGLLTQKRNLAFYLSILISSHSQKKKKILLSRLSVCLCLCIFFEKNKQTNKQRGSALLFLSGSPSRGANFPPIRLLLWHSEDYSVNDQNGTKS